MTHARLYRPSDESELVRLAAAPMPGWARLRYDIASGYAAAEALKGDSEIVVVEDADGHVAGCGTRSTTLRYLDGVPARIGYLGGLRSFPGPRGGFGFFRGFRFLAEIERANPNALTFTTILDGNAQVRALLTSGRAGIPAYCPRGGIVTYALAPNGRALAPRAPQQFDEFRSFYAREAPRKQLFPVLDGKLLPGLLPEDFLCIRRSGRIVAAGAVWHHGMRRRIFIDGYGRVFSLVRPLAGVVSRLVGLPVPPPAGRGVQVRVSRVRACRKRRACTFRRVGRGRQKPNRRCESRSLASCGRSTRIIHAAHARVAVWEQPLHGFV